jgi:L-seryl-tRNA(Ser) seleniumtransferase
MDRKEELRNLPSVNEVLESDVGAGLIEYYGRTAVKCAVQRSVDNARSAVLNGNAVPVQEAFIQNVEQCLKAIYGNTLKPMINATGVVLHTNLGRAPLGSAVIEEIVKLAGGYSSLEFDLDNARRGHRSAHVKEILKFLTGAEDAVVVNNNAAGIVLALHTVANGRDVLVSRGELIEIGGSFRIPEIMAASGANMVEVGATNRTHLQDYEEAISERTALIFKAHKSNYELCGFTQEVTAKELTDLAHSRGLPMLYDIGSGLVRASGKIDVTGLENEPDVVTALDEGADLVAFSCDKLLGGPQAGVVAGSAELVGRLAKAPMMRAMRVGKLTLAALTAVCRQYLRGEDLVKHNPTFMMLNRTHEELEAMATRLADDLKERGIETSLVKSSGQPGGGTLPNVKLKSVAVEILPIKGIGDTKTTFAELLYRKLLNAERPILAVLREGRLVLDMLTVFEEDVEYVAEAVAGAVSEIRNNT